MKSVIPYYLFKRLKPRLSLFFAIVLSFIMCFSFISCKLENPKGNINKEVVKIDTSFVKPLVIELIADSGKTIDVKKMETIINRSKVPIASIYQWKNHVVIFDPTLNIEKLIEDLDLPVTVKKYDHPFYNFNRKHCDSTGIVKEWDNIILTANLVKDTVLQNEYLNYHATQFEKWPEVSKGFCNADFQQLLVFKNSRQLMLIISIPKGESLDKLNPKTTENNPRVNDWNNIMKKYQEGIEGTDKGETWVFFKPVVIDSSER